MYDPSIWDSELTQGRQNYLLAVLHKRTEPITLQDLAHLVDVLSKEHNEIEDKSKGDFHNSNFRRILTRDIDSINRHNKYHFIISSTDKGVKIANKTEASAMIETFRNKAIKTMAKAAMMARKAGLDCQITISGDEIKTFMEDENE